jgi:voltage-gated potassium channel
MVITTLGSDYWPHTTEGRVLCFLLALYAFTVFGYITASLASFFIDRDADRDDTELAGQKAIAALRDDIARLTEEVRAMRAER